MKLMEPFEHSSIQQSAAERRQPTECSLRIHITKRPPMRARTYLALPTCLDPSDHLDEVVTGMSQPKDGVLSQDREAAHTPGATRLAPLIVY